MCQIKYYPKLRHTCQHIAIQISKELLKKTLPSVRQQRNSVGEIKISTGKVRILKSLITRRWNMVHNYRHSHIIQDVRDTLISEHKEERHRVLDPEVEVEGVAIRRHRRHSRWLE